VVEMVTMASRENCNFFSGYYIDLLGAFEGMR